ncbi:MAG: hypothetical protein NWQ09_01670 [Nonlabens sp.]|nr:hypothetical protein [Nonlabens sp.]MDP5100008.1 hypothetical protein [Nonlabens sp.]
MFETKQSKLIYGIIFDLVGMLSYAIPFIAEVIDIIWAPISLYLMTKMYPGKAGVAAGIFSAIEELTPGLDIIPSFTITWFYTYVLNPEKPKQVVEVDS